MQYLGAEGQRYCNGLVSLLKQSDALIFAYDQLAGSGSQASRLQEISTNFTKDKEVALAAIEAGKQVAGMDIEKLLADRFHEVRSTYNLTGEEEQRGRMLLSRGSDKETLAKQALGWGNVARDMERAIEKICFAGHSHSRAD